MCGIAGILSFANNPGVELRHVVRMANAMKLRGPDDEGYVAFDPNKLPIEIFGLDTPKNVRDARPDLISTQKADSLKSKLVFGHRRLKIQDLTYKGHQPMSDCSGRYWIIFNGEIYNFKELRHQLESFGHIFRTQSDTEVILAAYSEWEEGCLSRFNGDFAFAIWDKKSQSLFCARDRIGVKPFYYVLEKGRFIFASDIKTLLASGLHRAVPDYEGLYLAMAFGIAPRPITAFRGIRALEQAHWIRLHQNGRIEKSRYWSIPIGTQESDMKEADAIDLIEEKLKRAVSRRLVADVPVGTFMSGGIDSTTISAIAARQQPGIKAFTLGYQSNASELDEVQQAKDTAQMHPMQHVIKHVNPDESLKDLRQWILSYEEPYYCLAATHVISKLVKENNIKVVLSGLGGDELFAGYDYYRYAKLPRIPLFSSIIAVLSKNTKIAKGLTLLTAKSPDRLHTHLLMQKTDFELRSLFTERPFQKIKTEEIIHNLYAVGLAFTDSIEAMSFMDLTNYIGNHHVHRVDQFTMAFSIEARFPFLDHELIEASYRVPSKLKMKNNIHKYVLRGVAQRHIGLSSLKMKKKGFGLPLAQWLRGPLKPLLEDSLNSLSKRPQISSEVVNQERLAYKQGRHSPSRIWHLAALELWFQYLIDIENK